MPPNSLFLELFDLLLFSLFNLEASEDEEKEILDCCTGLSTLKELDALILIKLVLTEEEDADTFTAVC